MLLIHGTPWINVNKNMMSIINNILFKNDPHSTSSSFYPWTAKRISSVKTLPVTTIIFSNALKKAGFTFQQCQLHHLIDLGLALGLSKAKILETVGPDTGYIFSENGRSHQ